MPHNNNITQLTDSSDESSVDRQHIPETQAQAYNNNNNNIMTMTSFEEDGSISCDVISTENPTKPSRVITEQRDNIGSTRSIGRNQSNSGSTRVLYPPKRNRNQRWVASVLGIAVLICFGVGIYFFLESRNIIKKQQSKSSSSSAKSTNPITMEELMLHNDPTTDCWLLLHGTVYDLTEHALQHPGGPEYVTDFCGTNATKDYMIEHPKEYLNVYLSDSTVKGIISTSSATTSNNKNTTDSTNNKDSDNKVNDESENEEDDEDEDEDDSDEDEDEDNNSSSTTAPISTTTTSSPTPAGSTVDDGTTSMPTSAPVGACISFDEVLLHNTDVDCYYILYGYVYDFTNYIDLHPGGARRVFQECGTDATVVYSSERFHDEELLLEINAFELYGLGYAC